MRIDIFAAGFFKQNPLKDVFNDYCKRIQWTIHLQELSWDNIKTVNEKIRQFRKNYNHCPLIVLDEKGDNLTSKQFSLRIDQYQSQGLSHISFVIGGPDGLTPEIRNLACSTIAFGKLTWPHLMVRILLIEQIYRSYQILHYHPYHRE